MHIGNQYCYTINLLPLLNTRPPVLNHALTHPHIHALARTHARTYAQPRMNARTRTQCQRDMAVTWHTAKSTMLLLLTYLLLFSHGRHGEDSPCRVHMFM